MNPKKLIASLSAFSFLSPWIATLSYADLSEADYQAHLKIAEKKIARVNAAKSFNSQSANALSSSLLQSLFGRYYRVGDQWDVASWSFESTQARMTSDPRFVESRGGTGGIFHYEVIQVKKGPKPEVVIQVTQKEAFGFKKVDGRIQALKLLMNDSMAQSEKTYLLAGPNGNSQAVSVSPEGIHSSVSSLELFPLDVPELLTAESKTVNSVPTLPEGLKALASQVNYKPNVKDALWFEQDDFFGRPIQALWQQGDPWPAYYKTSNGISILIRKGAL